MPDVSNCPINENSRTPNAREPRRRGRDLNPRGRKPYAFSRRAHSARLCDLSKKCSCRACPAREILAHSETSVQFFAETSAKGLFTGTLELAAACSTCACPLSEQCIGQLSEIGHCQRRLEGRVFDRQLVPVHVRRLESASPRANAVKGIRRDHNTLVDLQAE